MPLGIDFAQIFLHLFNVIILFAGLYYILYKPVKKFMDEREESYAKREREADEHLREAEKTRQEYEANLAKIREEISAEKQQAAKDLDELRKKREQEADEAGRKMIREAEETAKRQRRRIMMGIRDDIEEIISIATEKIVLGENRTDNFDALLDEVERSMNDAK